MRTIVAIGAVLATSAAAQSKPLIACNPSAIRAEDRARHGELTAKLKKSVRVRQTTRGGYDLELDPRSIGLDELGAWVSAERLCCPFLTFRIEAAGTVEAWRLRITGPPAARAVLDAALGE